MEFGNFLNTFVTDAPTFWLVATIDAAALALFSVWYNRKMDDLGSKKLGYTAILVAIGNGVTLLSVAILSWKAAVLVLSYFVISGTAMILGDIRRADRQREQVRRPRRKALPYAAANLVSEAIMTLAQVERGMKDLLEGKLEDRKLGVMALAVKDASHKLQEAIKVEGE